MVVAFPSKCVLRSSCDASWMIDFPFGEVGVAWLRPR
jgi:hypothetical protein